MKDVICLAVGQTYDLVVNTNITAHPDVAPYPRKRFKFVVPIKKGGSMEYLFPVKYQISCFPEDVYEYKDMLNEEDFAALIEYHQTRKEDFGYGKTETKYTFYIMGNYRLIKQPFEKKGTRICVSMDLNELPILDDTTVGDSCLHLQILNEAKLGNFCNAFVLYEMAMHGVDPRQTLDGTDLRLERSEGYKYSIYSTGKEILEGNGEYVDKILNLLVTTKQNLVDYHQITKLTKIAESSKRGVLEDILTNLYEGENDEDTFNSLTSVIGGSFDVLGFLFFLKDSKKYLPIRSSLFDERFNKIGVDLKLSGNCSFRKYNEFLGLVIEVQAYLQKHLNKDINLLDAHSFLWILPYLEKYLNQKMQPVVHKKFGQGVITGFEGDSIIVEFGGKERKLVKSVTDNGILTILPLRWNIYSKEEPEEKISASETYAKLNKPRIKTIKEWELILRHEMQHNKGFNFVEKVLLEMYKRDDYAVFCKAFEKEIGCKGLNLRVGEFRNRIKKIDEITIEEQIRQDTNTDRAWNIPFQTDEWLNANSEDGSFCWILRKELVKAMENVYPELKKEREKYNHSLKEQSLDLIDKPVIQISSEEYLKDDVPPQHVLATTGKHFPPKADYVQKQIRNKVVGDAGEEKVVHDEKKALIEAGRGDLAEKVNIVPSDAYGFDVISYQLDGEEKHIEVKTSTNSSDEITFHITANEVNTILNDPLYELHYLYATKEKTIKKIIFSNQQLKDVVIQKYMMPTQYMVKMKKND